MVRKIVGLLVLLFAAGLNIAAQDTKDAKDAKDAKKVKYSTVIGLFESYKNEILTMKVENKEKEFKVPGDTPVGYSAGKDKSKILKAKVHLKDVKKDSAVAVTLDGSGKKVLAVGVFVKELPKEEPQEEKKEKKEEK